VHCHPIEHDLARVPQWARNCEHGPSARAGYLAPQPAPNAPAAAGKLGKTECVFEVIADGVRSVAEGGQGARFECDGDKKPPAQWDQPALQFWALTGG
jgi:hypothetical protein